MRALFGRWITRRELRAYRRLALHPDEFRRILKKPWVVAVGSAAQFIIMPLGAFVLALQTGVPVVPVGSPTHSTAVTRAPTALARWKYGMRRVLRPGLPNP